MDSPQPPGGGEAGKSMPDAFWAAPGKVVLVYVVVAGGWVVASDFLWMRGEGSPVKYGWAMTAKGLAFVGGTAALLFYLLRRWKEAVGRQVAQAREKGRVERVEAEASLRRVSGSFLRIQDEERRRIARELHDTTAQGLVAVSLGLSEALRAAAEGGRGLNECLEECRGLLEQCTRDIRTLSYGLHPPLLDEMGLPTALEEYVRELGARSGVKLEFTCAATVGRFAQEAEMALFRVAQEALLNLIRHSGSGAGQVRLREGSGVVELEVGDSGRGIPTARLDEVRRGLSMGVGIAGMRERLRPFGGDLEVTVEASGVWVRARLPLREGVREGMAVS